MLSTVPISDGSGGAVVVASETGKAVSCVLPFRTLPVPANDVICWADFHASSTSNTIVGNLEWLVRNDPFDEGFAQDIAVDAWPMPLVGLNDASLSFSDERYE